MPVGRERCHASLRVSPLRARALRATMGERRGGSKASGLDVATEHSQIDIEINRGVAVSFLKP